MVHRVKPNQRDMTPFEVAGAKVQVSDPIVGPSKNLAAGFTEYLAPSRYDWTFDYDEVFFMVEGYLEVHAAIKSRWLLKLVTWAIFPREP